MNISSGQAVLTQSKILTFQKGNGVQTNSVDKQWVNLTDAGGACIVMPDTCTQGGSLAMWVRVEQECSAWSPGILTSAMYQYGSTGFVLRCHNESYGEQTFR